MTHEVLQYRRTKGASSIITAIVINAILISSAIICILPVWHIFMVSLSASGPANANLVGIWPIGFNYKAYSEAVGDKRMVTALIESIKRIFLGVPINMLLTILCAYPLSHNKQEFPLRSFYSGVIIFTMLFSGGLIPTYILMNRLHLMNTLWALVLPGVPVFNCVIMMNFFRQIPAELREAASIDGASHFTTLVKIILPISGAVMATLTLFCFVSHWNAFTI